MACDIHIEAVKTFGAPIVATEKANLLPHRSVRSRSSVVVTTGSSSGRRGTVYLQGALRAPLDAELRRTVCGLLRRGERLIVVDLAGVRRIDAAGVGELVRAYNMAVAAQGGLRIVHSTTWVREIVQRVGLFEILTEGGTTCSHPTFARVPQTASSVWRQCP
jgi:anti-anti-sigma factor